MRASDITDTTPGGYIRRWAILDGQPRCPFTAVDPWRIADSDVTAILAANATVRASIAAVTAYEDAVRLLAGEEPPATIPGTDENGAPVTVTNPAHTAWVAAEAVVADATEATIALADLRAGRFPLDAETGEPIVPEPDAIPEDTLTLWAPVPNAIPAFQGRIVLKAQGLYAGAVAAIAAIPDAMTQAAAEEGFNGAGHWSRDSAAMVAIATALDLTKEETNGLFRAAAALNV
jgi:hypothetical protein